MVEGGDTAEAAFSDGTTIPLGLGGSVTSGIVRAIGLSLPPVLVTKTGRSSGFASRM